MIDLSPIGDKKTNYRWYICLMLFVATTINYMDRQVLSWTWSDYIAPEFHWTNNDYGDITAIFSLVYAVGMLFAGKFIDWMDTKKGFLWTIGIWSLGACVHAYCGIATSGILTGHWLVGFAEAKENIATVQNTASVVMVSVYLFIAARCVLAIGEAGNFPASIKSTAEYFPKKDRAFSTSIFNAGATVGALAAPMTIPYIAAKFGWEMAFILIGGLGFIWMAFWVFVYKKPEKNPRVNAAELAYINQDKEDQVKETKEVIKEKKIGLWKSFTFRQTWAFIMGKFMTDGVWWFFLFWAPAYLKESYGLDSSESWSYITVLYLITILSVIGGWLPTYFVNKGMNPYAGRMKSMLIFACFPLLILLAQPMGTYSVWFPVIIIGIGAAAHQSWSANIFSTVGDMFPKVAIATITGIGGMAGGIGSAILQKSSGLLFDYAKAENISYFGFSGIQAGYFIIFTVCAFTYLIGWCIMKILVPRYKPIILE